MPALLHLTWRSYARDFIQHDGRVIDHNRAKVSTSEGESYALLRAVFMNDRATFAHVWKWTQNNLNLHVRHDHLFGFLWGRHGDGRYYVLSSSSATDADQDIALALVFAARRWGNAEYQSAARAVISDIWRYEVLTLHGTPYLTAGNWATSYKLPGPAIDPSYLAPYAYRIFARIDRAHRWMRVVDSSYRLLTACSSALLRERRSVGLPPDWCALSPSTGAVLALRRADHVHDDDFGYDAFRTLWRVALDARWYGERRARSYLRGMTFLHRQWRRTHVLTTYTHDGRTRDIPENATFYGGDIGAFIADSAATRAILRDKLLASARQSDGSTYWDQRYAYFEQNWVWFGVALAAQQLPNLAAPR